MRLPQGAEWLVILVLILLLFGAKRLPDAARGLGRSLRILKAETQGLHDDDAPVTGADAPSALPAAATAAATEAAVVPDSARAQDSAQRPPQA
jgi:sec-independent protein translocase protein TatA